jgi:hypothetical protein
MVVGCVLLANVGILFDTSKGRAGFRDIFIQQTGSHGKSLPLHTNKELQTS